MDNLRASISIIFGANCPDKILSELFHPINGRGWSSNFFLKAAFDQFQNYNLDEINNVFQKLDEDWFHDVYQNSKIQKSIFNLLIHFSKKALKERNFEPFVSYEHLLRWRSLSYLLGEDLFTCSYFAYMDNRSSKQRSYFGWKPVVFSTNNRLKNLLEQGVAENHFHLKGSAPIFELSWMALMNDLEFSNKSFKKLKSGIKLSDNVTHSFGSSKKEIDVLVYKASYIRWFLFEKLNVNNNLKLNENYLKFESNRKDSFELINDLGAIQREITASKTINGYSLTHKNTKIVADYAIPKNIHEQNFEGSILLTGERKFMYDCFKMIYANTKDIEIYENLFYAYLTIKNQFRAELIQINNKVGFANFSTYQDRKELFIPENSIYETAFLSMAINDTIKTNTLKSFETRITPKNNSNDLNNSLIKLQKNTTDNVISKSNNMPTDEQILGKDVFEKEKHFYTIHFIKKPENKKVFLEHNDISQSILPRHNKLRKEVKQQARAIVKLRESYSEKASLIKGIDAASSEFSARPEVFAQAFRYLKDHKLSGKYDHLREEIVENKLYATFHAGEDFYDIVDGLRTIDESIKFLKYCQGDRLGHALALGINVKDYFEYKGRKLMIPKEMLLDNIVWLLAKIRKYDIEICRPEVDRLEKLFDSLFNEIYQDNFENENYMNRYYSHSMFFDAWKLRGDDPMLYLSDFESKIENIPNVTYWERCRINHFYPKNNNIRNDNKIKFLYHEYHFNPKIKRAGKKIKQFTISDNYIKLVAAIQKAYQGEVQKLNIGIECNPTSNFLIGTIDKYEKHPIVEFFNLGLETDPELIKNCSQLFVSINTDDQGIFGTSLENEYALMAIALEKAKDEHGNKKYNPTMIYDWLDKIRKMGIEQSFK